MKYNIGIFGRGFVGSAVAHGMSSPTGFDSNIRCYDIDPKKSTHSLEETICESDFVFISVPTPANKDGSINLNILNNSLEAIQNVKGSDKPIILVRSTITPGTSRTLQKKFSNLKIVFNPEFLTERSAYFDFISQSRIILGGEIEDTTKVEKLYRDRFGNSLNIIKTNYETAELIKYMCNIFFATKISFLNEMKLISNKVDADWETAIDGFVADGRIGSSHNNVPGHDGKLGFGGSCFPKDIQALLDFSRELSISLNVVEGAWKTNLEVRPEKDWELLKGRAISDDD